MSITILRRTWLHCALALLLALPAAPSAFGRSSGGYSRPGGGSASYSSRRPSFGGSGGYARPGGSFAPSYGGPSSGGDRSISRRSSSEALQQYRTPPPPPASPAYGGSDPTRRPSTGWSRDPYAGYGGGRTRMPPMAPPSYAWAQPGRSFGVFDGLLMYGLLNSLSRPDSTRFFQANRDDPGYRQWRAEADRSAATDSELRARLDALDSRLAQAEPSGQPAALPEAAAEPAAAPSAGGDGSFLAIVLFVTAAGAVLIFVWRRRRRGGASMSPDAPAAVRGSAATRFRVGMTFPVDPTPFVLAGNATKIRPLEGGMVSVEAVGVLMDGGVALNRLYVRGRESFFLLHLGADGRPDECRYFSRIDEVTPASQDEWGAWLDAAQGMIGWPQFQTKDGKLYQRVWSPGAERVRPRELTETVQDLKGQSTRKLGAMLYGAATGVAAPAPSTEYILVAAVDAAGEAFVEIHAGIDVNPASLELPSVPL